MTIKHTRCDTLGVCQGRCKMGSDHSLQAMCSDPDFADCSPEPAQPTYPFAPGTIEGPRLPIVFLDDDDGPWLPLTLGETLKLLATMLALGVLAGYLVERFA